MPHSVFDTMIAAYNIYGDSFKVGLKDLSGRLLHQQMISFFDLLTKYDVKTFDSIPIDEAAKYAAADAHQTLMLYQLFIDMIEKNECYKYLMTIEMPLVKTLYTIEKNGFTCDKNILDNQRNILMHDLNIIMQLKKTIRNYSKVNKNI
jgi:DNA polymerase-1